ncbi:Mod5 sorting protein [Tubulinosema ratisbonensis]|uniref:Mod5 sorting protein n=1 Tax=Tubulinosema ratisbonensis TaxID=291195 RepID=A0A437ALH4_9MICR|nr:Mod5 sorting protein [Tubulinosema ratisbonensis]
MRLIQAPQLLRTNLILEDVDPNVELTMDAYKCKLTKKQRKNIKDKGVFTYIKMALQISFPNYCFDDLTSLDIKKSNYDELKESLSFRFSSLLSNYENDVHTFLLSVFDSVIYLKNSTIYCVNKRLEMFYQTKWFHCYFFYNKKRKRLLLFVAMDHKN